MAVYRETSIVLWCRGPEVPRGMAKEPGPLTALNRTIDSARRSRRFGTAGFALTDTIVLGIPRSDSSVLH
jgi:hypothetical protein